jgi:histidinol phosphatase-like enzyme
MWDFQKLLTNLGIQIIIVNFQQGINNNSFIKPLTNNYHINSICIDDIIALKTTLNNVLITLNVGKIRDIDLINHNTMPKGDIYDSIKDYKF